MGEALLVDRPLNETFCRETERELWEAGCAATEWTNMMLRPPPADVLELFAVAAQNQGLADELIENFNAREQLEDFQRSGKRSGILGAAFIC